MRTVFNILGPLANPSRAKNMVVGVYDAALTERYRPCYEQAWR